jgi:hypothetical protein
VRNLRIVRLSVFNKLLKAQDLRNAVFVRVLPEEPILSRRTFLLQVGTSQTSRVVNLFVFSGTIKARRLKPMATRTGARF